MRTCLRCGSEMQEGCTVRVAVCPKCGEVSIYLDDVDKLKN